MGRMPQRWLRPGDVCEVEIEGLGVLRNPVTAGEAVVTRAESPCLNATVANYFPPQAGQSAGWSGRHR